MSQRGKRGNRLENENSSHLQPPIKRRKGRPPTVSLNYDPDHEAPTTSVPVVSAGVHAKMGSSAPSSTVWQARSVTDLKIYNRSSSEAPAELFRKDLISAMKLPDSEPLSTDEYWVITDQWKQEWERGVQVPVNPDSLPEPSVKKLQTPVVTPKHDFKLPKNKYIRITKDETFSSELHYLSNVPALAESACSYDLDQTDEIWLKLLNNDRAMSGFPPISDEHFERVIEELEVRCWDKIQAIMRSEEGLGIEYDENVICDVCRSPDSEEANEMVFCDKCNICVHQACYGITTIPSGQWLCRTCSMEKKPDCVLCPNKGGAMKSTRSGKKWAHVSCALWIPEVSIGCVDRMEPITKISNIPQSRWALLCILCREKVGACIQCSVKTCKTAYHVTCAFQHGLEMRAIIEEGNSEDGVKLRSYCLKHSVSKGKKDKSGSNNGIGSGSEDDDCRRRKLRKDMTSEERNQVRAMRLQEVEAEFDKHVNIKDISCHLLDVDQEAIPCIYNYWILKRKSGYNRPLIPRKAEDVDMISNKQEQADIEKKKMFVHLRQDLERVRNLCYMVNRREKFSRSFFKLREQIFHKQIAVLSESSSQNYDDSFINVVLRANNLPSVYDRFYSSGSISPSESPNNNIESIIEKIKGIQKPADSDVKQNRKEKSGKSGSKFTYTKIHVNGISDRKNSSIYDDSCSSTNSDDDKLSSSTDGRKSVKKKPQTYTKSLEKRKRRKTLLSVPTLDSSSEDESIQTESQMPKKNQSLHQMEKDLSSTDDSDELMPMKNTGNRTAQKKASMAIYSDSDTTDKEKTDNTVSDSQQHMFRTKAAMKEFTLYSAKSKQEPLQKRAPTIKSREHERVIPKLVDTSDKVTPKDKEKLKIEKSPSKVKKDDKKNKQPKSKSNENDRDINKLDAKRFPTDFLVVPQRQAAKKASENMRSTNLYTGNVQKKDSRDGRLDEKESERIVVNQRLKDRESKDEDREKDREREREKDKDKERSKPRGRPPKHLKDENRERNYKDYNSKDKHSDQKSNIQSSPEKLIKFEKEDGKKIDNNLIVAYVPQRQAAKKAAEHIKSGMGKTAPVDQISAQGEEKDKERDKEKDKDKERDKCKDKDKDKEREKERLKDKEHDSDKEKNKEREKSIEKHLDEKEIEESMKIKTTDWESSTEKGIVDNVKVEKEKTKSNEKKEPSSAILLSSTSSDYSSSSSTYSSSSSGESDNETNDHEGKGSSSPRSRFASISDEKAKEEVPVKEYEKDTENSKEIIIKSKLSESDVQDDSTSICNNNIQKEIESISLTTDSKINDLQEISSVNSLPNSNNNILEIQGQSTESIDLPEITETHERKKLDSCFVSQKVEPVENDVEPRNCLDYFISDRDVLEEPMKANEVNNHHNDVLNFPNKICDSVDVPDQTSCEDTKNIQKPTFILDLSDSQDETPKSFTTEHDSVKVSHTDTQEVTNRSNNYKQRTPEIIDVDSESLESVKSKEDNSRQSDKELQNKTNLGIDIENSKIISTETKNAELLETFRDKNLNDCQSNINLDKLTCTQTKNRSTQPNDSLLDLVPAELPNNLDNEQKPIGIRHNDAEDFLKRTICDFTAESIFESKPNEEDSARETMNLVEKLRQKYKRSSSNNSTKPEDILSNQIENKATDLKLKSDVPISADVFHQNAKVTTCPRKDDLLVLPDTNATQDGSILSGLTANETTKIDMTTSKEHLPATLNDTSVGFMNNDTSLTLDIARNPCKDIMAIIEKRAESYLERQLTAKVDKIVKSNTDCFDNIAARNFFKDDFGDIQEKENMCVSSMSKLDCEYDDSTRMQSPFTNTANIWNENDLIIQTRRSISTSPSSISESNDDFKPLQSNKQLAMNEEQPTTHHQTQLQSHHQSIQVSHHPQQHHQSQHQTPLQSHVQHQAHNQTQLAAPHQPQTQSHAAQHPHSQHDQSNNQQQQSQHSHQHQSQQQHQPPQQQQQSHLNSVRCDTQNLDKHSFNMLQTLDMSSPHFPMQQQSQTVVNGVDMLGSYNFPENNQFNGPVSLFAPPPPPVSNLNVQMPFPSPGAGMFPPTLGGGIPLSQATTNQSTTALYQHIVKHDQNISSVSQNNEGHYSLLGQPCGAAFTSSSHNLALTAAIVSTSVGGPVPISSPQMIHSNNFNLSNPNLMASTHDTGSSLNQMMNCDVLPNNNLGLKDSPSKRTSARFNQQIKSPQMHKSPGKSPRQMELLSKQHNASNANKTKCEVSRPRNRSTRGTNSNRARGRGRGRGRVTAISQMPPALEFDNLGSIHNHLAGTVYDLDFDDDLTSSCNVEDLKSLRDRRRSFDCRGNSQNVSETKFTSPNHHSKFRNSITQRTISELKPPPVISPSTNELSNTHSLLHNIHPVLPGPVDMRTYNSGFENQTSSSQEAYNSHLLGAFASGTAEQTLPEFDEEVEKEFQSVLKASGTTKTTKVVPEVVQTELQTCLDTTSEEISIDSDTTNTKVSLSDSRNQLKLKIKGPLAHPDTYNSSTSGANISQSLSSEQNMGLQLPSQTNCSLSTISNTTGTSSLRRMRKKELLRQYWNQDMNNDDSACLPPTEATATSDQAVNRSVGIPKAVDSLSSIPTKDDYKDYTAADPRKRKKLPGLSRELRQLDIPYESERPERRRSAGSTGSNMSSTGNINESLKVSMKRRNKVKASDSGSNSETPRKLKIKIGNNVIETGSDSKRVVGYPPKKRLSNIVPSLEIIKRDSMNFRKQVMADFDEEEKEKRPRTKPKKEYKDSRKKKKKEKRDQVQVIDNTKIIIRIGKRKAADDIQSESKAPASSIPQSHSQSQQESEVINTLTSESNAASRTEKNPFVGIRLKIARKSDGDGYVIDPPKDKNDSALILEQFPLENITSDHEQSATNAEESGSQMSNPATAEATVSVLSTHKTSDLKGQNNASNGCQLLPLNKDCEVR